MYAKKVEISQGIKRDGFFLYQTVRIHMLHKKCHEKLLPTYLTLAIIFTSLEKLICGHF